MSADVLRDARYAVRQLGKDPRLRDRRRPHAGARHRRHQRDLQRRQRRAAAAAAVSGAGCASFACYEIVPQYGRFSVAPATFLDWRKQIDRVRPHRRLHRRHRDVRRQRRPRARRHRDRLVGSVRPLEGLAGPRPWFHRAERISRGRTASSCSATGCGSAGSAAIPACSGAPLTLSGEPVTIVGVMPPDFFFPSREIELWRPHRAESRERDSRRPLPRR